MNPTDAQDLAAARRLAADGSARRIRVAAGLSCAELAAAIDVTRVTVSRWERGQRSPHGAAAVRWVRLLRRLEQAHAAAPEAS